MSTEQTTHLVAMAIATVLAVSACGGPTTTVVERSDGTSSTYDESGGLEDFAWDREECWADGGTLLDRGGHRSNWCLVPPPADYEPPVILSGGRAEAEVLRRVEAMDESQLMDLLVYLKGRYGDVPLGDE